MKNSSLLIGLFSFLCIAVSMGCSKEDNDPQEDVDPEPAPWEIEVEQLIIATSQYLDFQVAIDESLIDISGFVPNMGHHFLNPDLSDGTFELEHPEIILYAPDDNGDMQMVAVEYSIIPDDPSNPGSPPEGFTGSDDIWHFSDTQNEWQLHVWIHLANPGGMFALFNPNVGI